MSTSTTRKSTQVRKSTRRRPEGYRVVTHDLFRPEGLTLGGLREIIVREFLHDTETDLDVDFGCVDVFVNADARLRVTPIEATGHVIVDVGNCGLRLDSYEQARKLRDLLTEALGE